MNSARTLSYFLLANYERRQAAGAAGRVASSGGGSNCFLPSPRGCHLAPAGPTALCPPAISTSENNTHDRRGKETES